MAPRAVFFDMDDTLLDTSGGVEASWELACGEVAGEIGCEWKYLRDAIVKQMMHFWRDEAAVEHWRTKLVEAREHVIDLTLEAEGFDKRYTKRISDRYGHERAQRLALFEDALGTLETLREGGIRLGLITNGPAEMQRDKVTRFDLERYFDVVVIEGEFGHGKPSPKVFEHALTVVGADALQAWHVGDNLYADIGGAKKAGLNAAWIHRGRLELKAHEHTPDRIIEHLPELGEALGL